MLTIVLHNLPEGMAIGVSLSNGDLAIGLPLTSAIAIQDIPEGLAVAIAVRAIGMPRGRAVLVAIASGLMEPLGALLGGVFGITLMLWICIQFYMFPLNFMSTAYFVFGLCQAAAGFAAWRLLHREEAKK